MKENRKLLKNDEWVDFDDIETDQSLGKPRPDVQKPYPAGAKLIDLVAPEDFSIGDIPLKPLIQQRKSHRLYTEEPLTLEELSFLLWATQGIRDFIEHDGITYYYRNIPSGGNRHALETYLSINRVDSLDVGLYRYLPLEHKLLVLKIDPNMPEMTNQACLDQTSGEGEQTYTFTKECAVLFVWTTIPYRMEWRYNVVAHKMIAIEAGHACQNLYLACGAIGAGTCAIGAFDRIEMDKVLDVDGEDEFSLYVASVGKVEIS